MTISSRVMNHLFAAVILTTGTVAVIAQSEIGVGEEDVTEDAILGSLMSNIRNVSTISVVGGDSTTSLYFDGEMWRVKERFDTPADPQALARLVDSLSELTIMEPRTSRPELFAELSLDLPITKGSETTRLVMRSKDQETMFDLVIGDVRYNHMGRGLAATYVRLADAQRTWQITGALEVPTIASRWIDCRMVEPGTLPPHKITVEMQDQPNRQTATASLSPSLASNSASGASAQALENLSCIDIQPRSTLGSYQSSARLSIEDAQGMLLQATIYRDRARAFLEVEPSITMPDWWRMKTVKDRIFEIPGDHADRLLKLAQRS